MANKLFGSAVVKIKSVDFTNSKIETFTRVFDGCYVLEKITFGENCKKISESTLDDCANLKQIVFESASVPTIEKQNASMMKNIIIEVPEGKEEDYQTALDVNNPGATVTAEEDILRYTSTESIEKQGVPWIKENHAKWSEIEIPGEIIGKELYARFIWSREFKGESVSGTFNAKIEKGEYNGSISDMTGTEVFPSVGKDGELLVYPDKAQSSIMFTIRPYSELSENTEYTDSGYTYSFVNVEKPIYSKPTYEGVVVLKDEITDVGKDAFNSNSFLTAIKLPQQIASIGNGAFKGCTSLTSIELPSSLTSIGDDAFSGCTSLTSIDLPSSLTSIGAGAFYSCSSLTSIDLPSGLTSIGDNAFNSCSSLTSIDLPSGLTSIGNGAFMKCEGLTSIDLPSNLTSIGDGAFQNCSSLTSIDLPSNLTSIGDGAFQNCSSLTSIDLPSGLTSIGDGAFNNCSSLASIDLPSGLTSIGDNAFNSCSSLTSIDLPSSVETINYNAFGNCYSVTSVICRATTPPTLSTEKDNIWFSGLKTDTCQVPSESISEYEIAAANWSSQFKKFVAIQ